MKLASISIRNFRLLRRVEMDFAQEEAATVLVGPNNSGKTSVMEAIRLFAPSSTQDRKNANIHDFSLSRRRGFAIAEARLAQATDDETRIAILHRYLPVMRITMWFDYSDTPADLNVVAPLLMSLDPGEQKICVRIQYSLTNALRLLQDFDSRRNPAKSLDDVAGENLQRYFDFSYWKLSPNGKESEPLPDNRSISNLIRIDTISAQRHIDDAESGRAAKISQLLHEHYTKYVREEDEEGFEEVEQAIEESARVLTEKYEGAFTRLKGRLETFGYPAGNARPELRIRAEMSSATIYRDNTKVYYRVPSKGGGDDLSTDLPERYNGLGYKNLIYILLKLESFRSGIEVESGACPAVHLIAIEEPEAHLHPQMQSVFIREVSKGIAGESSSTTQFIISTHSPHMVADSGFRPIRYFRKDKSTVTVRDMSRLEGGDGRLMNDPDALKFLRRYIKLTHCDLLFADKAVLVEGQVEKLLLPAMIENLTTEDGTPAASSQYITVLEIGGAYAHIIDPLIRFIGLPTLIITDIDSALSNRKKCRVSDGEISTNAAIKFYLPDLDIKGLLECPETQKVFDNLRISYQVEEGGDCGRSFEEAFLYANRKWIAENLSSFVGTKNEVKSALDEGLENSAYEFGQKIHKVDFALDLMNSQGWKTPKYIHQGLKWLAAVEGRVHGR